MTSSPQGQNAVLLALDPSHFPTLDNARQTLIPGQPHPENPVLRPRPGHWDGTRCKVYGAVLVDPEDGLFKMWYSGGTDTPDSIRRECGSPRHTGYACSTDGVHWERPSLGIVEFNGSRDNNLLILDAQAPSVFLFDDPPDPSRRFMMFVEGGQLTNQHGVLYSPDGIHWQRQEKTELDSGDWGGKTHEPFSVLYDPLDPDPQRRWKGYSLLHINRNGYRGRAVGLFTAAGPDKWVEWPEQPILSAIDGMESEIHIPHVSRFHDTYLMLYDAMEPNHHTQTEVAVSDDGIHFRRVQSGVKLIPNGAPGEVNAGKVCVSPRSLLTHAGKIWWYHTVSPDTYQTTPRSLYASPWYRYTNLVTWRQEGMACLECVDGGVQGRAETGALEGRIESMWLNAATGPGAGIVVEVIDEKREVIGRSRAWRGDELRGPVVWQEAPKAREGFRIRLRMEGRGTRVYAVGVAGARFRGTGASPVRSPEGAWARRPCQEVGASIRWAYCAGAKISSSPALWRDLVLAGSWDQCLHAVEARTGKLRWKFETGNSIVSAPAVHGQSVYITSRDGFVYAIEAESGKLRWKSPVHDGKKFNGFNPNGAWIDATPAIGAYAPRWNALGRDPQTRAWGRRMEPEAPHWLYVGAHDRQMHAFDLNEGVETWRTPTFNWILSRAAVDNFTVYFGSMDGHIYALDAQCGAMKWRYRAGRHLRYAPPVVPGSVVCEAVCGSPLLSGGTLWCGGDDGFLYALDAATGAERWVLQTGKWIWGRPLLCGEMLLVASADGCAYGVEAGSGKLLWRRALGAASYGDVTGWGDAALVACTDGRLHALEPRDGAVRWTIDAGAGLRAAPAVGDDSWIYLTNCAGELCAIAREE